MPIGGDLYSYDLAAHKAARLTSVAAPRRSRPSAPTAGGVAFVRAERPLRGGVPTARPSGGSPPTARRRAERQARLGLPGGGLRPREVPRPLVEPRLARASPSCGSTRRRCRATRWWTTSPRGPPVEVYPYPEGRRPEPGRRRWASCARRADAASCGGRSARYAGADILIVDVALAPGRRAVVFQVQDREQTWLDLNVADPRDRRPDHAAARDEQGLGGSRRAAAHAG